MALNVDLDLGPFERFVPCGLPFHRVTRLADLVAGRCPAVPEVAHELARELAGIIGRPLLVAPDGLHG